MDRKQKNWLWILWVLVDGITHASFFVFATKLDSYLHTNTHSVFLIPLSLSLPCLGALLSSILYYRLGLSHDSIVKTSWVSFILYWAVLLVLSSKRMDLHMILRVCAFFVMSLVVGASSGLRWISSQVEKTQESVFVDSQETELTPRTAYGERRDSSESIDSYDYDALLLSDDKYGSCTLSKVEETTDPKIDFLAQNELLSGLACVAWLVIQSQFSITALLSIVMLIISTLGIFWQFKTKPNKSQPILNSFDMMDTEDVVSTDWSLVGEVVLLFLFVTSHLNDNSLYSLLADYMNKQQEHEMFVQYEWLPSVFVALVYNGYLFWVWLLSMCVCMRTKLDKSPKTVVVLGSVLALTGSLMVRVFVSHPTFNLLIAGCLCIPIYTFGVALVSMYGLVGVLSLNCLENQNLSPGRIVVLYQCLVEFCLLVGPWLVVVK